ncbi:acyl carrier protein [Synechococcus sp. CCAP 1479/10]|uniref:acyl carrier protein n=1 Tax=Synechococcus sp. CCAP 1479/10 TaxID=1221594 RepID=UPI001C248914|nr:acyl carrier protein [Synechococcus sp. CCAP 1479/10]
MIAAFQGHEGGVMDDVVRRILDERGDLSVPAAQLGLVADLFDAGLSSFGAVEVMVGLEEHFGSSFPDRLLRRETFSTIGALIGAAEELHRHSLAA